MSHALNHRTPISQGVVVPGTDLTWHSLFRDVGALGPANQEIIIVGVQKQDDSSPSTC